MEVELVSNLLTHPPFLDGWRFEDDAFPKKGNLLPVEGLNNVLSFFFKQGVWVYTKGLVFTQFFQNGENVLLSDKADIYHSDRTILDDDGKSNGRLGRMCKLVCHFDQTLRIHVWYMYIYTYLYLGYIYHKNFHHSCRFSYTSPIHGSYMAEGTKKRLPSFRKKFLTHFFNCEAHPNERQTFYRHANQLWEP